jgi:hypothetical protein
MSHSECRRLLLLISAIDEVSDRLPVPLPLVPLISQMRHWRYCIIGFFRMGVEILAGHRHLAHHGQRYRSPQWYALASEKLRSASQPNVITRNVVGSERQDTLYSGEKIRRHDFYAGFAGTVGRSTTLRRAICRRAGT